MELIDQVFFTSMAFFIAACLVEKGEVLKLKGKPGDVVEVIGLTSLAMMFICILIRIWQ